jgi:hypothetical protein
LLTIGINAQFLHRLEPSALVLRVGVAARVSAVLVQKLLILNNIASLQIVQAGSESGSVSVW